MTKHANTLTETVSSVTSRRGFLRRISRIAAGFSAGAAGLLAGMKLNAAPSTKRILCCRYITSETLEYSVCKHNQCPERLGSRRNPDWLVGYGEVSSCDECGY